MEGISMIIPLYKGEAFIPKLLTIARNNYLHLFGVSGSYISFELVFVNDYPEKSINLDSLCPDFDWHSYGFRIQTIENKKNIGIHASRVVGLKNSSFDYVVFLDQDDEINDSFLAEAIDAIGKHDVVIFNGIKESSDGSKKIIDTKADELRLLNPLSYFASYNQIESPGQCLLRKAAIPQEWLEYILKYNCADDLFLWILLFSKKRSFIFVNRNMYTHKYTGTNLSLDDEKTYASLQEMSEYLNQINYISRFRCKILKCNRKLINLSLSSLPYFWAYYIIKLYFKIQKIIFDWPIVAE